MIDWYVEGLQFGNCVCAYGCPCQFEALPTHGYCEGFEAVSLNHMSLLGKLIRAFFKEF
ncbi:MAG: DUF1326 domain-containing protein [bacterium]|nr:DUF1326 domain-containing protein [bacterium]